jgi:hypothetical protein
MLQTPANPFSFVSDQSMERNGSKSLFKSPACAFCLLSTPPGPPMTLGNMGAQGVHHLVAYCLNDACRAELAVRGHITRTGRQHVASAVQKMLGA